MAVRRQTKSSWLRSKHLQTTEPNSTISSEILENQSRILAKMMADAESRELSKETTLRGLINPLTAAKVSTFLEEIQMSIIKTEEVDIWLYNIALLILLQNGFGICYYEIKQLLNEIKTLALARRIAPLDPLHHKLPAAKNR